MEQAIFFLFLSVLFIGAIAFGRAINFLAQHRTLACELPIEYSKWRIIRIVPEHSPLSYFFVIEKRKKCLWFSYWQEIVKSVEYRPGKFTQERIEYRTLSDAQQAVLQLARQN